MKRALVVLATLVVVGALFFFFALAPITDRILNRVSGTAPAVSSAGKALHDSLLVADMHADALLWPRDLLDRANHGHVDLPRLQDGNVALQVFSVVSKTPRGLNYEHNSDLSDNITLVAMASRWPRATWGSLRARALFEAGKLRSAAERSNGKLQLIKSSADVDRVMAAHGRDRTVVGALQSAEGLQILEGRLDNVDTLYAAGFRMLGLTHFFDNEVAGSAHGMSKGGLTPLGRQVVQRMEALHVLVDLAHSSPRTIDDVLAMATRPVVVSHTGVQATCPGTRNLTDDQLRRIAANGGVVGIGYWDAAVCDLSPTSISLAIMHAARIAGIDHVGLGSDFDGSTVTRFDTGKLAVLTDALLRAGLSHEDIGKIMGGNVIRVLKESLPAA